MKAEVRQHREFTLVELSLGDTEYSPSFQHYSVQVRPTGSEISLFLRDNDEARKLANQILSAIDAIEETEE